MNASRIVRHSAIFALASTLLVAWLGACNDDDEACGNAGVKDGTCQVGPSCGEGSVEILISDPSDACPGSNAPGGENYICCVSSSATSSGSSSSSAITTPVADAATKG